MLQVSVEVQSSLALFERIFDYLEIPQDIVDAPDAVALPSRRAGAEIELDHVYFRYDPAHLPPSGVPRTPTRRRPGPGLSRTSTCG